MPLTPEQIALLNSKRFVAIHECGHALLAYTNGQEIGRIVIRETEPETWGGGFRHRSTNTSLATHLHVQRLLAGAIAQHEELGVPLDLRTVPDDARTDLHRAWVIARGERPDDPHDYLNVCAGAALGTIRRDRKALLALAARVEEEEYLSGTDVIATLAKAGVRTSRNAGQAIAIEDTDEKAEEDDA